MLIRRIIKSFFAVSLLLINFFPLFAKDEFAESVISSNLGNDFSFDAPNSVEIPLNHEIPTRKEILELLTIDGADINLDNIVISTEKQIVESEITKDDINTSIADVYTLYFEGTDNNGDTYSTFTNFVVGENVLANRYVIFAESFSQHKNDIEVEGFSNIEMQINANANIRAYDLTFPKKQIAHKIVSNSGYTNNVGIYEISITVQCSCIPENEVKKIYANIYNDSSKNQTTYIEGKNRTITINQAKKLLEQDVPLTDSKFLNLIAWELNQNQHLSLIENQHYTVPKELKVENVIAGLYPITFKINGVEATYNLQLIESGQKYIQNVSDVTIIPIDGELPDLWANVETNDYSNVKVFLKRKDDVEVYKEVTSANDINLKQQGTYEYEYQLYKNRDLLESVTQYYVVGDNPIINKQKDMVVFSKSKISVDVSITKEELLDDLQVAAVELSTGREFINQVTVDNAYMQNREVGPHKILIDSKIDKQNFEFEVLVNVLDTDITTFGNIAVFQKDITLRRSEIKGRTAYVLTQAKVWNTDTGEVLIPGIDYTITDMNFDKTPYKSLKYQSTDFAGYEIKIDVPLQNNQTLTTKKMIQIESGSTPEIVFSDEVSASSIISLTKDQAKNVNIIQGTEVKGVFDNEDTGGQNAYYHLPKLRLVDDGGFVAEAGVYTITYAVLDADYNETKKQITYVIDGIIQNEYVIFANNIFIKQENLKLIQNIESFIQEDERIGLRAYQLYFNDQNQVIKNEEITDIEFENVNQLTNQSEVGGYKIDFTLGGANFSRVVNVINQQTVCNQHACIHATNTVRRPSEIIETDVAKVVTNAKSWNAQTGNWFDIGTEVTEVTDYVPSNLVPLPTDVLYPTRYQINTMSGVITRDVTVSIVSGYAPTIIFKNNSQYVYLEKGQEVNINVYDDVEANDFEDGVIKVNTDKEIIDLNNGNQVIVTYQAIDKDGNVAKAYRYYIIRDKNEEVKMPIYILNGRNIIMSTSEFADFKNSINKNNYLKNSMNIKAIQYPNEIEVGPVELALPEFETETASVTITSDFDKQEEITENIEKENESEKKSQNNIVDVPNINKIETEDLQEKSEDTNALNSQYLLIIICIAILFVTLLMIILNLLENKE